MSSDWPDHRTVFTLPPSTSMSSLLLWLVEFDLWMQCRKGWLSTNQKDGSLILGQDTESQVALPYAHLSMNVCEC